MRMCSGGQGHLEKPGALDCSFCKVGTEKGISFFDVVECIYSLMRFNAYRAGKMWLIRFG